MRLPCQELSLTAQHRIHADRLLGYSESGDRLVAGVVPLNEAKTHVLLIQSTRRNAWVLPKGGWENDEECTEAAQREAWEEAGIVCTVDYDLGQITETRT